MSVFLFWVILLISCTGSCIVTIYILKSWENISYYLRLIPYLPKFIWVNLWIRRDEYHKTLGMDHQIVLNLNEEHQKGYGIFLEKRRRKAHNKSLKKRG
jgi:hypothetical protein